MYSSIGVFLQVFVEILSSKQLVMVYSKDSASKHALKTKFIRININTESSVFEQKLLTTELRTGLSLSTFQYVL